MRCLDNSLLSTMTVAELRARMSLAEERRTAARGERSGLYPPPFLGPAPHTDILGYQVTHIIYNIYTSPHLFSVNICDRFLLPLCYLKVETKNFIKAGTTHPATRIPATTVNIFMNSLI